MKGAVWTLGVLSPRSGKVLALAELSRATVGTELRNRIAHAIADSTRMRVSIDGARANPTLVHHHIAQGASYHILGIHGQPLADLYTGPGTSKVIAQAIADEMGIPVRMVRNDGGESGHGSADPFTAAAQRMAPRRNPATPVFGQVWKDRRGQRARVLSVTATQVSVLNLDSGDRERIDLRDFTASWKRATSSAQVNRRTRNPKGRKRNPAGDTWAIFGGKYVLEEGESHTSPNLGHVRTFTATGKRGAVYGALLYEDGRFQWMNVTRGRHFGTVPFDLAQVSPARFIEGRKNPSRSSTARARRATRRMDFSAGGGGRRARRAATSGRKVRSRYLATQATRRGMARFGRTPNPKGQDSALTIRRRSIAASLLDKTLHIATEATARRGPWGPQFLKARDAVARYADRATNRWPEKAIEMLGRALYGGRTPNPKRRKERAAPARRRKRGSVTTGAAARSRVSARRNPRRGALEPGERVSVPYTGRLSYFGRKVNRTREHGKVEGINPDGSIHVSVKRGRGVESHTFPASAVRRLPSRVGFQAGHKAARSLREQLEDKARRERIHDLKAAIKKASNDLECAEARARELYPQAGESPSPVYRAQRARIGKLGKTLEAQAAILAGLEGGSAGLVPFGLAEGDPFAAPNPRKRGDMAKAKGVFRKWHNRAPGRITHVKGPKRVPKVLAKLGTLESLQYRSDKWAGEKDNPHGKQQLYEHRTKRPKPLLASDGRDVFIVGGNMTVTPDGFVN